MFAASLRPGAFHRFTDERTNMAILPVTPTSAPQALPGLDQLDGCMGTPADHAQPDDDFDQADLLAGNAGLGPDEIHEPEVPAAQIA
jgi:hypothetical protein